MNATRRVPDFLLHRQGAIDRISEYTSDLIGMRNVLSHGYFKVDLEAVWQTIQRDLPALGRQVRELRGGLSATSRAPIDPSC